MQSRYWAEMYQLKVHLNYMESLLEKDEKCDRYIKIFMAIASSGSIAGWVIWKDLSFLWGLVIAISQVLNAILPFLPYKERIKCYRLFLNDLEEIFIYAELKWFDISSGKLSEEEIHKLWIEIKSKKHKSLVKNNIVIIPDNSDLSEKAEDNAIQYFSNLYKAGV